jgi:hypothetical protein
MLITTNGGGIFRTEPSTAWHDPDPFDLKGKDLDRYFEKIRRNNKGRFIPHETFVHLKEAIEEERERRAKSEDAYDHSDLLPYDQFEKFPGMMKHIDVPSTPKDYLIYMGDTKDPFYDEFPEGHSDARAIRSALQILNKVHEEITEDYASWFKDWLAKQGVKGYVWKYMAKLADELCSGSHDPETATRRALSEIDRCHTIEHKNEAVRRLSEDPVYEMIFHNFREWKKAAKDGKSVYAQVKAFGRTLFETFSGKMEDDHLYAGDGSGRIKVHSQRRVLRRHHWDLYRRIKARFAPKVILHGIDINRCDMGDLRLLFGEKADRAFFARPFESINHAHFQGFITKDVFADFDEVGEKIMAEMEKAAAQSRKAGNLSPLNRYRAKVIQAQKRGIPNFTNWSPVWAYYHILKKDLQVSFNEEKFAKEDRDQMVEEWLKEHLDDREGKEGTTSQHA